MDDQRPGVAKICDMAENLQRIYQFDAGVVSALHRKGEQPAGPFGANAFRTLEIGRGFEPRIGDIVDTVIILEPSRDFLGVFYVAFHAQRKCLCPHQRVMRRLRVHRHAKIAQPDCDTVEGEGQRPEGFVLAELGIGGDAGDQRGLNEAAAPFVALATGDDPGAGYRVVQYSQADAVLHGLEGSISWQATGSTGLTLFGDSVRGKLKDGGHVPADWWLDVAAKRLCGIDTAASDGPYTAEDYGRLAKALGVKLRQLANPVPEA